MSVSFVTPILRAFFASGHKSLELPDRDLAIGEPERLPHRDRDCGFNVSVWSEQRDGVPGRGPIRSL